MGKSEGLSEAESIRVIFPLPSSMHNPLRSLSCLLQARYTADALVYLRIEAADMPMRLQVKEAGGRWNPDRRLWLVNYGKIAGTPLEKHIQVDAS